MNGNFVGRCTFIFVAAFSDQEDAVAKPIKYSHDSFQDQSLVLCVLITATWRTARFPKDRFRPNAYKEPSKSMAYSMMLPERRPGSR